MGWLLDAWRRLAYVERVGRTGPAAVAWSAGTRLRITLRIAPGADAHAVLWLRDGHRVVGLHGRAGEAGVCVLEGVLDPCAPVGAVHIDPGEGVLTGVQVDGRDQVLPGIEGPLEFFGDREFRYRVPLWKALLERFDLSGEDKW